MIQIVYEGVDITGDVSVSRCILCDSAGGQADTADVSFPDGDKLWGKWHPKRGHRIQIISDSFDTGEMYIDNPDLRSGEFTLSAISTPISLKQQRTRIWRNVKLSQVINDIAAGNGLKMAKYSLNDYTYKAVSQARETDLEFLSRILLREGYIAKIFNGTLVVYSEKAIENITPLITITPQDVLPTYSFSSAYELFSSFTVIYSPINGAPISYKGKHNGIIGGAGKRTEYISDLAEAERFAFGYLRAKNKQMATGSLTPRGLTDIAAGSTINVSGFGFYDGSYFVDRVIYDAVRKSAALDIRQPLNY